AEVANAVLSEQGAGGVPPQVVTDVAGVKEGIVTAVNHPRFVGGHPMAGSEQEGVDGADPDLFLGATWVLTPGEHTSPDAYAEVQSLVRLLGANPVVLQPRRHDELVALVSHTPHLTAATLMNLAADAAASDAILLRLAAGGFRDMTRVAAGHPGIWPDVVAENRAAILSALDRLRTGLDHLRHLIASGDRAGLLSLLERAREGRVNLPTGAPSLEQATEVRIPVPDRPGVIAEVSTLLGSLGVNIFDVEIAHSAEGDRGVMVMVVDASKEDVVRGALASRGYRASLRRMEA
ncbi:MAG TPA: prephenate dehydrogenase/arogenate dehydrogenase family protein, partial [Acidimicrobiales bacterium]|nr:prephenate dehydrogenase/arogenate dehydrogenase family protein [Acidimicrobiales bacterium]